MCACIHTTVYMLRATCACSLHESHHTHDMYNKNCSSSWAPHERARKCGQKTTRCLASAAAPVATTVATRYIRQRKDDDDLLHYSLILMTLETHYHSWSPVLTSESGAPQCMLVLSDHPRAQPCSESQAHTAFFRQAHNYGFTHAPHDDDSDNACMHTYVIHSTCYTLHATCYTLHTYTHACYPLG